MTAIIDWVERGTSPDRLVASLRQDGRDHPHATAVPLPDGREVRQRRQQG